MHATCLHARAIHLIQAKQTCMHAHMCWLVCLHACMTMRPPEQAVHVHTQLALVPQTGITLLFVPCHAAAGWLKWIKREWVTFRYWKRRFDE